MDAKHEKIVVNIQKKKKKSVQNQKFLPNCSLKVFYKSENEILVVLDYQKEIDVRKSTTYIILILT